MKKGISLIVLVITIIVMIIIAGAIIISLNSTNIIDKANEAVTASDLANARNTAMLKYAELAAGNDGDAMIEVEAEDGTKTKQVATAQTYIDALSAAGFDTSAYSVTANSNGIPTVNAAQ